MERIFYCLILSFLIVACSPSNENKPNDSELDAPELIMRTEKIQQGKEWDDVQNMYQDQKLRLKKNEEDLEARINLALIYIKEARVTGEHGYYYPAALGQLDKILNKENVADDVRFRALTIKAGVQLSLHEFEDALATGKEALQINDKNAQIHGVLLDAYVEMGEYDKAIAHSDKMVNIKPDLRSYSRVSYLREIHGDVEGAEKAMMMAVKASIPGTEESAWTMLTLGDIYFKYGSLDKAESIYQEILSSRSDYPFAIGALGNVEREKGNHIKAEKLYQEAIAVIPEVGFYIDLASLYQEQNRMEELQSLKEEILVMLKEDTDSGHNMNLEYAQVYLDLFEDPNKSMEYVLKEYQIRPKNIDVNLMMARIHKVLGEDDHMKKYIAAAKATNSKNPDLLNL